MGRSIKVGSIASGMASSLTGRRGGAAPAFDPASLFGASDEGAVFDFTTADNLAQASDGSTPVTAENDPIGYVADVSGKDNHATQATAGNKLLWRGIPKTLGTEALSNGRLESDTVWSKGTGWTITAPSATKTAGSASVLSQDVTLTPGQTYQLSYTMTRSAGTLTPRFTGGTTVSATAKSASGTYTEIMMALTRNTTFEFSADASFAGTVKSVTLKPVTDSVLKGGWMFGSPRRLVTSTITLSGSDKLTIIVACQQDQAFASTTLVAVGNWATTNGTAWVGFATPPVGRLRGDTGSGSRLMDAIDGARGAGSMEYVDVHEFDIAETLQADEITVRTAGVERAGTLSGSAAGGGNLANSTIDIGEATFRGIVSRVFIINRLLTADERAQALSWVRTGRLFTAVLGDSTTAGLSGAIAIASRVSSFTGGLVTGRYELANSGHRIADQLSAWNALDTYEALQLVIVQIGLNDVKGRVGEGTATTAQVIADLQNLIDTIRADVPASCKIYVAGLTPCKVWLDTATNPADAYQAWLDVNAAIAGTHTTNITGVDGRITSHVAALNDGSGNLAAIYDYNDDGVHESNEARFIIAQAWRAQLEADGLL